MTAMLQVAFMAIGLAVLIFVIAFLFKKWQRAILWAVALLLFVGTSIMLGAGVLKIYENGMINHAVLLGITLAYACSFIFIYEEYDICTRLAKAKQLLEEYGTALKIAADAADKGNSGETPQTTVIIHEAAPSYVEQPQKSQEPEHPELPTTVKGLFAYLLLRMPRYYVQKFFFSRHVRWMCRAILFSLWLISICLTCIIAHDNARLHTVEKKYVLLREFARQNKEWADKADLIEYLYTDEAEHQEAIQTLWENRRKRLERR